ncbi:hypothetical protein JL193_08485 [Polaribacter batillariae]|uniref:Chain length determinant protein n=1 Tax=Polaribacter batillariae TaxID=2808900 RepID=A0ABX7SQ03_9FLAO|nr:hypothetical protein [Polaribacter batillariae]QTD36206.1 hypothetical protein JL193_08485 [Polaribacter batillariae]
MSTNQQKNNEEEVDLGSLFVIIGKGFKKIFNFIGAIFEGIFHAIISILIFLKDNIVKIAIATAIGFAIGLFLQITTTDRFESDMLVQPNFKSSRQLYNNVNYYNDLVKQKDTLGLQNTFHLSKEEAASLRKFTIEPVANQNDVINSYNNFVKSVDTTTVKSYSFEEFEASFTDLDYKIHKINVVAEKNDIFDKLGDVMISSVVKNKYFNRLKELTNENLNRTDSILRQNLTQIDTLRRVYMQVMVEEAKKQTNGTSIDLGGEKRTTKELELFETNKRINNNLKDIAIDKSEKYEIINVISNFQPIGTKISGITKNKAVQLGVIGAFLIIFILLLLKLNTFLNTYKK